MPELAAEDVLVADSCRCSGRGHPLRGSIALAIDDGTGVDLDRAAALAVVCRHGDQGALEIDAAFAEEADAAARIARSIDRAGDDNIAVVGILAAAAAVGGERDDMGGERIAGGEDQIAGIGLDCDRFSDAACASSLARLSRSMAPPELRAKEPP